MKWVVNEPGVLDQPRWGLQVVWLSHQTPAFVWVWCRHLEFVLIWNVSSQLNVEVYWLLTRWLKTYNIHSNVITDISLSQPIYFNDTCTNHQTIIKFDKSDPLQDVLTTDPNVLKSPRVKLFISQLILEIQRRSMVLNLLMFFTTMHNDILKPKLWYNWHCLVYVLRTLKNVHINDWPLTDEKSI